jgi:hypothetical protein
VASKRKPAERVLAEVLQPDVEAIFVKPGREWDVVAPDPSVPAAELARDLGGADAARRLAALRAMSARGRAAVCHPELLPSLIRRLLDPDAAVRAEAGALRDRFLHERNRVLQWLDEPAQKVRCLAVASWRVGSANAEDALQEFVYNTRETEEGPAFYYYSLPNVIASYDPGVPHAKPFFSYFLRGFTEFCGKAHRRLRGDRLAVADERTPDASALFSSNDEMGFLLRHSMLRPRELACLVRWYVHDLRDDEEMEGEDKLGVLPGDRRVYRKRGLQKLAAARRFFERVDALPVDCRAVVRAAFTGGAPGDLEAVARGEEILLAAGYAGEIRALAADPAVGLPARERDAALLHHGDQHLPPAVVAERLETTVGDVLADLRRAHGRVHRARLTRLLAARGKERRDLFERTFVGDLSELDAFPRHVAVQLCVRWPLVSDASRFLEVSIPRIKLAFFEAQGMTLRDLDDGDPDREEA